MGATTLPAVILGDRGLRRISARSFIKARLPSDTNQPRERREGIA